MQPRSNRLTPRPMIVDSTRVAGSCRAGAALDYVGCGRWQPTAGTLAGR